MNISRLEAVMTFAVREEISGLQAVSSQGDMSGWLPAVIPRIVVSDLLKPNSGR
jgi:hypothetical protein